MTRRRLKPDEVEVLESVVACVSTALACYEEGDRVGAYNVLQVYMSFVNEGFITTLEQTASLTAIEMSLVHSVLKYLDKNVILWFKCIEEGSNYESTYYTMFGHILKLFLFLIVYVRVINGRTTSDIRRRLVTENLERNVICGVLKGWDVNTVLMQIMLQEGIVASGMSSFRLMTTQEGILRATDAILGDTRAVVVRRRS